MPKTRKSSLCREMFIATAASTSLVALLVAVEYATIASIWPESLQEPLGHHIKDFAVSANGAHAAYVLSQGPSLTELQTRRFELGTLDMKTGRTEEIRVALPATPTSIVPTDREGIFYVGCLDGSIICCDTTTDHPFTFLFGRGTGAPSNLLMTSDGRTLIVRDEFISAWDIETGAARWQLPFTEHRCACISPAGERLYCGFQSGKILVVETATGDRRWLPAAREKEVLKVAISPRGDHLAMVACDGRLDVARLADGQIVWSSRASVSTTPAFTANGGHLLVADAMRQSQIVALDAKTGAQRYVLGNHRWAMGLRRTHAGRLFTWSNDGSIAAWDLVQRKRSWISKPAEKAKGFGLFAVGKASL